MIMGKQSACFAASSGIKRGPWTPEEDRKLLAFIQLHGHGSWRSLPQKAGLKRCGKSCRLRWRNYLRPDIKRGNFSLHEDQTIIQLHALLGNRWSAIAAHLPKRTDNEIKNYWNSHLKKRLAKIGFDPVTHKPKTAILGSADGDTKNLSNLSHIAQWESARLQAEARFVKESNLRRHESHETITNLNPAASILLDQTALLPAHHHLDLLRASAWESLISMSKSSRSAAAPIAHDIINGQDHVYHGVNNNFEATTFDHDQLASMTMMEYDVDGDARGMSSTDLNELIGQYCGNECSELFAAVHQNMEGFEVGDSCWTSLEEFMLN